MKGNFMKKNLTIWLVSLSLIFGISYLTYSKTIVIVPNYISIPTTKNQTTSLNSVIENKNNLKVTVEYMSNQEVTVIDPNSEGKISDKFDPYNYPPIINTISFFIKIENLSEDFVEIPLKKFYLKGDNLDISFLDSNDLIKIWKHYYYINTDTPSGSPNIFEQERSIVAENFIKKSSFKTGRIPPKGSSLGIISFNSPTEFPDEFNLFINEIRFKEENLNFNFKFKIDKNKKQ